MRKYSSVENTPKYQSVIICSASQLNPLKEVKGIWNNYWNIRIILHILGKGLLFYIITRYRKLQPKMTHLSIYKILLYQEIQIKILFSHTISNPFNFLFFKELFNTHSCNFHDVNKNGYSRASWKKSILKKTWRYNFRPLLH